MGEAYIINQVINRTGIPKTKAVSAAETVLERMKRALSRGERIELRGFGTFNVRPRIMRWSRPSKAMSRLGRLGRVGAAAPELSQLAERVCEL